jgi:hypothetical protein
MTESLISSICKLADAMVMSDSSYLCEKIGSGYDGWYIYIKDKLKNVRRKSDEPSVTCRKKLKMSDKTLTSVARKRSIPKGCIPTAYFFTKIGKLLNNSLCNVVYLMT